MMDLSRPFCSHAGAVVGGCARIRFAYGKVKDLHEDRDPTIYYWSKRADALAGQAGLEEPVM